MARKAQLDAFDVRESFAIDPLGCIDDRQKRSVLREQDFCWRPWVGLPYDIRRAGEVTPARWAEKYWNSLSGYLQELVDPKLGPRFADLLVGYLLVVENETPGRELRPLRPIIGSAVTSRPQHAKSLKLVLSGAIVDDLIASGLSRKIACEDRLPKVWEAIGVKMKPASSLRMERRARNRITNIK